MCSLEPKPTFISESFPGLGKPPEVGNASRLGKSSNPHSFAIYQKPPAVFLQNEKGRCQVPGLDQMSPFSYRYWERSCRLHFLAGSQPCPSSLASPQTASQNSARKTRLLTTLLHFWLFSLFFFFFYKESQINLTWGDSRDVSCSCCCKAQSVPVTTRQGHKNYSRMNDTFLLV